MTDNNAIMVAAKYTWDPFKFFAGYEYIWQNNPTNPLGVGASDQGGYFMSGVEDNNLDSEKFVQIWWTGVKYAIDSKTDITFVLVSTAAERLPCSVDLLGRSRFPQLPARVPSTRGRSMWIITSPSVSTVLPELRIPG